MNFIKTTCLAALLCVAGTSTANAAVFASFTSGSAVNVQWKKAGTSATLKNDGSLFSTASATGASGGNAVINFTFAAPVLNALGPLAASIYFFQSAANIPAVLSGTTLTQGLNQQGSFLVTYIGTSDITVGGKSWSTGATLIGGTLDASTITGQAGSRAALTASAGLSFFSDFLVFDENTVDSLNIGLTSLTASLARTDAGSVLTTFRAKMAGDFSSSIAPVVTPVPEPEIWVSLVLGFGLVGFGARRSRSAAVPA